MRLYFALVVLALFCCKYADTREQEGEQDFYSKKDQEHESNLKYKKPSKKSKSNYYNYDRYPQPQKYYGDYAEPKQSYYMNKEQYSQPSYNKYDSTNYNYPVRQEYDQQHDYQNSYYKNTQSNMGYVNPEYNFRNYMDESYPKTYTKTYETATYEYTPYKYTTYEYATTTTTTTTKTTTTTTTTTQMYTTKSAVKLILTELEKRQRIPPSGFVFDLFNATSVLYDAGIKRQATFSELPILKGLELSANYFIIEPCAIIAPILHPRAGEILIVLESEFRITLIEENTGRVLVSNLKKGEIFAIPQGLIHAVQNLNCKNGTVLSAYKSEEISALSIATSLFQKNVPQDILTSGFAEDDKTINLLREGLPFGIAKGRSEECLKKCA